MTNTLRTQPCQGPELGEGDIISARSRERMETLGGIIHSFGHLFSKFWLDAALRQARGKARGTGTARLSESPTHRAPTGPQSAQHRKHRCRRGLEPPWGLHQGGRWDVGTAGRRRGSSQTRGVRTVRHAGRKDLWRWACRAGKVTKDQAMEGPGGQWGAGEGH